MALAVCLLFDDRADRALRSLWDRLEDLGIPTLRSHTHGRHVPHLSYAVVRDGSLGPLEIRAAVAALPDEGPIDLHFDGLGTFRRGRSWLVPAVTADLARRQRRVAVAVADAGAELHRHYCEGVWVPHCTLAPRVPMTTLPVLAAAVYDVLPFHARAVRAAVIESATGESWPLTNLP